MIPNLPRLRRFGVALFRFTLLSLSCALAILFAVAAPSVSAQEAKIDPTFSGGLVTTDFYDRLDRNSNESIQSIALQIDGKILVAGNRRTTNLSPGELGLAVARYNPDGTLDRSFADKGRLYVNNQQISSDFSQIAVQPDSKITVMAVDLSTGKFGVRLLRFDSSGQPDTGFGHNGTALPVVRRANDTLSLRPLEFKLLPEGGYQVFGQLEDGFSEIRVRADGSLDSQFGTAGIKTQPFKTEPGRILSTQPDGRVYEAGTSFNGVPFLDVVGYSAFGVPDGGFGTNGLVKVPLPQSGFSVTALLVEADRALVIALSNPFLLGLGGANPVPVFFVRLTTEGKPDERFGPNGVRTVTDAEADLGATGLFERPQGGFAMVGSRVQEGRWNFLAMGFSANGKSDPSFGSGGRTEADFNFGKDQAQTFALQPDGKILLGGTGGGISNFDFALVRLKPDGVFDSSFGDGGRFVANLSVFNSKTNGVVIQPDGKIVSTGQTRLHFASDEDIVVLRFNPDGTPDLTFGKNGVATADFNHEINYGRAIALQSDGKIVVTGESDPPFSDNVKFLTVRFNPDGSLDRTFGNEGMALVDLSNGPDAPLALAIQSDGQIILGGISQTDMALVRLNADGMPDPTFGKNGKIVTDIGPSSISEGITSVVLQPDGKIVVGGFSTITRSSSSEDNNYVFARYTRTGEPDAGFGNNGMVRFTILEISNDIVEDIRLQSDGKIVGCGSAGFSSAVVRLLPNGTLDPQFGTNGKFIFPHSYDLVSVHLQNDGKIVSYGVPNYFSRACLIVTRINANGTLDKAFARNGVRLVPMYSGDVQAGKGALQPDGKLIAGGQTNFKMFLIRCDLNQPEPACPIPVITDCFASVDGRLRLTTLDTGSDVVLLINGKEQGFFYEFFGTTAVLNTTLKKKQLKPGVEVRVQIKDRCGNLSSIITARRTAANGWNHHNVAKVERSF